LEEVWKDIKNFEGLYQVSNLGRVRSLDRTVKNHLYRGKIMKPVSNGKYLFVKLSKNGVYTRMSVHRIVATAFFKFDENSDLEVNHIDHNKINNKLSNLEIVTHKENMSKAFDFYGGVINKYGKYKLIDKVYCKDCGKEIYRTSVRCMNCEFKRRKIK
jgi:hypothetical protein